MPEDTARECPMCTGSMHLRRGETTTQIPGNPGRTTRTIVEWVCPDCDYFEEAEEENP